ncbi:MAG: hypothetical protein R3F19_25270 [Verrucomicrobiales bacterium]|nr:hypothetical protein [Verrucomicrobiae bacterium]
MKKISGRSPKFSCGGYTLVEVAAASTLLFVGIAAATVLSLTMVSQEEANHRVSRALHLQECAARMFQLGLSGSEIDALLPNDPTIRNSTTTAPFTKISFAVSTVTTAGFGSYEQGTCTMNFSPSPSGVGTRAAGTWTGGNAADRNRVLTVVRPSIR